MLTTAQLRTLASRVRGSQLLNEDGDLTEKDLAALGYSNEMARRIAALLSEEEQLRYYLSKGRRNGCVPLVRAGGQYPLAVRKRLGLDSPGCLWAKGDLGLLDTPCVSLVGSRELRPENLDFARETGMQAAKQGYTLVSGNARGADKTAQEACLDAGGSIICVVADSLLRHRTKDKVLYLSEDGYDEAFSPQRALSRNRVIHCLGAITLVAQASLGMGGSWNGTVRNLQGQWNKVFCFEDGSEASRELQQMGAFPASKESLSNYFRLIKGTYSLFDAL